MERALNNILSSNDELSDIVGDRISPIKRDDGYPAITYEKSSREESRDASGRTSSILLSNFIVTARDTRYTPAKEVADMIIGILGNFKGRILDTNILYTTFNDESVNQVVDPDITEVILDFTFYHS